MVLETRPGVATLGSYHGANAIYFDQAGTLLNKTNVITFHPPNSDYRLVNPVDDNSVFVHRVGDDPNVPDYVHQIRELRNMKNGLLSLPQGKGFGYLVARDGAIGAHTAGEVAFLALVSQRRGVPIITSDEITGFRDVPKFAQAALSKAIYGVLPFEGINQSNIDRLTHDLSVTPAPDFSAEDNESLKWLVRTALHEQHYQARFRHALVASTNPIKRTAVQNAFAELHPRRVGEGDDSFVLVDSRQVKVPGIPEQPFQHEGIKGAEQRVKAAQEATAGYEYHSIVGAEGTLVAMQPDKFDPNTWATPDRWAETDREQIRRDPRWDRFIYADIEVIAIAHAGEVSLHYSRPVRVPTAVALEALVRGPNVLYSEVLQSHSHGVEINLADPQAHLTENTYPREQQLRDVILDAHR